MAKLSRGNLPPFESLVAVVLFKFSFRDSLARHRKLSFKYGAINRFLQPIGNIKQCSPRHTSTAASSKHVRCKLKPSSMDFIHIHFVYLNCYGLAALAIGITSITTWDAVFWSTLQDTCSCYAVCAALAFCAVWSTLGADARLASSSAFCAVCAIFACSSTFRAAATETNA